jgi:hypothetical protein
VFTALFLALLWSGLWARRDLQQKHDAAIAAAISQAKQRALTEYNQNVELAFKEWSTKTSASGRTWLSNAIRSVELRLEEAERKNQESNRKKTAQIAKDRADLKCRHERLKELKKSTAAAESAALAVRNSGIKALQA